MTRLIELRRRPDRLVAGMEVSGDLAVIRYPDTDGEVRLARRETFFLRDDNGQPQPETATDFYVPDWLRSFRWTLEEVVRLLRAGEGLQ